MQGSEPEDRASSAARELFRAGGDVTWKTLAPWVVAVGILTYLVVTTDWGPAFAAIQEANWALFLGTMFGLYVVLLCADAFGVWWVYRRYHAPQITYADAAKARAVTYLVGILNYAAGSAAMALFFKRRFGVGIVQGGASLLLLMLVDLGLVTLAVLVGGSQLPESASDLRPWINLVGAAFVLGAVAHLVFWRATWSWGPLEKLRQLPQLQGFRDATLRDYVTIGLIRAPITAIYIAMHALTLMAFAIHIPFAKLLVYVPIQMLVAVIPVAPSGLGTVQLAQEFLYGAYVEPDVLRAYGLALAVGFLLPRMILGGLALGPAARTLAASDGEST